MFLLFMLSLSTIFYFICMEFEKPSPKGMLLTGECPGCSEKVVTGWLVCPKCKSVLRESCSGCGKIHDIWVNFCPWCRKSKEAV
jgi:hypothetical protein